MFILDCSLNAFFLKQEGNLLEKSLNQGLYEISKGF